MDIGYHQNTQDNLLDLLQFSSLIKIDGVVNKRTCTVDCKSMQCYHSTPFNVVILSRIQCITLAVYGVLSRFIIKSMVLLQYLLLVAS